MKISRRVWLFAILLAAFALRMFCFGVSSLWYDETVSVYLAQQDLIELTRHTAGDIHPPFYYYLLHFWGALAGWSEFAMAFASLCFGILLIALVYRVTREWFNPRVALLAALFVAVSPFNLWYSQEVRMYTLGAVLGLASVYWFARVLALTADRRPLTAILRSSDFIAYAIVSALGLYTLYYFAFLLVFENLIAITRIVQDSKSEIRNRKSKIGVWVFSQLAILALYLPWAFIALRQATDPPVPPWRSFTELPQVLFESFSALAFGQSLEPAFALPALIVIAAVIAIALKAGGERSTVGGLFLLGYTFVPLAIIYALSLWKPLYHVRYVFVFSPAFYLLLALGLEQIRNSQFATRNLRFTFFVLLFASYLSLCAFSSYQFWFNPKYAKDDLRGAVNYIAERWRPGDAILINAGYTHTAFEIYYKQPIAWRGRLIAYPPTNVSLGTYQRLVDLRDGAIVLQTGSIGGAPNLGWGDPRSDFYATTADETRAALDRVFAAHSRVWMLRLYDTVVDPDGVIRNHLATRGRLIDDEGFAGESFARVQGYLTARAPMNAAPSTITRREVLLGNRIVLLGFEPASLTVRAGQTIDVNLYWQAKEPPNVDNRLFIGLYAADGTLVASNDTLPIGNALGTSRWTPGEILRAPIRLRVPAHSSPGIYNLRITMYNPLTNEALEARGNRVVENSQIELASVAVE